MVYFQIIIYNKNNEIIYMNQGYDEVTLSYRGYYQKGDKIVLKSDQKNIDIKLRLDDSLVESWVYLTEYQYVFEIPFDEQRKPYGEKAFTKQRHWGYVSCLCQKEKYNYRNLALNSFDYQNNCSIFPHASSNVLTNNPQFYARNAIDGIFETSNHGSWPHESWGINQQNDARLKIDFGRIVKIDEILIYLRADFPHDNWWKEIMIEFSHGKSQVYSLVKTGKAQCLNVGEHKVSWIILSHLKMSDEESLFPALSQIMVMGTNV